jgi:hypothetical protein
LALVVALTLALELVAPLALVVAALSLELVAALSLELVLVVTLQENFLTVHCGVVSHALVHCFCKFNFNDLSIASVVSNSESSM